MDNDFWDLLDGVLVINMDTSTERMARFSSLHEGVIPSAKLHRISAVVGRELPGYGAPPWFTEQTGERSRFWGGTAGCALSHRKALEYARAQGWQRVLILEDDVQLIPNAESLQMAARALQESRGKYIFYLGYNRPNPCGFKVLKGENYDVWQVDGVLAAHAYVVPISMYDLLIDYLPTYANVWKWLSVYKAVDVIYQRYAPLHRGVHIYVLYPMMAKQCDVYSDIGQNAMIGESMACTEIPRSPISLPGLVSFVFPWMRKIKNRLNSIRTHRRALRGGLPGFRKKKK